MDYQVGKRLTQKQQRGPATQRDMLKNTLSDTANWQIRKWSNCTQYQGPCLDDHQFKQGGT